MRLSLMIKAASKTQADVDLVSDICDAGIPAVARQHGWTTSKTWHEFAEALKAKLPVALEKRVRHLFPDM